MAMGPPWLVVHPIFDGESYRLNDFFESRILTLGEASGDNVDFMDIGNPRQHDEWYSRHRGPVRALSDERDADAYVIEVQKLGSEKFHRLREIAILAEKLGVPSDATPCLVFRTTPAIPPYPRLPIKPHWYVNPSAEGAFSEALRDWLSGPHVRQFFRSAVTVSDVTTWLTTELVRLGDAIEERVQDALKSMRVASRTDANVFKREGKVWNIVYEGKTIRLGDLRGLQCLAHLLATPGHQYHAIELRGFLDGLTRDQIRESLGLPIEQEAPGDWEPDPDALSRDEELSVASEAERARKSIAKVISRAKSEIKKHHPSLSQHLTNSLNTGAFLSYSPDRPTAWET